VLVAEDSPVNQSVAVRMLERCGVQADVAANGREALEALARGGYDAAFLDCRMPELDGYAATAELRRRERGRTPVIAMSSSAPDRERCLEAGIDDCLLKPLRSEELVEILERWIPGYAAPRLAAMAAQPG